MKLGVGNSVWAFRSTRWYLMQLARTLPAMKSPSWKESHDVQPLKFPCIDSFGLAANKAPQLSNGYSVSWAIILALRLALSFFCRQPQTLPGIHHQDTDYIYTCLPALIVGFPEHGLETGSRTGHRALSEPHVTLFLHQSLDKLATACALRLLPRWLILLCRR